MNKILMAIAATTFLAGSAFAGTYTGTVTAYDEAARSITLDSGTIYQIPTEVALPEGLAVGKSVSVETSDDDTRVTGITVAM